MAAGCLLNNASGTLSVVSFLFPECIHGSLTFLHLFCLDFFYDLRCWCLNWVQNSSLTVFFSRGLKGLFHCSALLLQLSTCVSFADNFTVSRIFIVFVMFQSHVIFQSQVDASLSIPCSELSVLPAFRKFSLNIAHFPFSVFFPTRTLLIPVLLVFYPSCPSRLPRSLFGVMFSALSFTFVILFPVVFNLLTHLLRFYFLCPCLVSFCFS